MTNAKIVNLLTSNADINRKQDMEKSSALFKYLIEIKAFKSMRDDNGQSQSDLLDTHLLYSGFKGGRLHVRDENYCKFLELYATDIENGINHSISEQRTTVFRMHMDNDFLVEKYPTKEEVIQLGLLYQKQVARFFESIHEEELVSRLELIVLLSKSWSTADGNSNSFTSGQEEEEEDVGEEEVQQVQRESLPIISPLEIHHAPKEVSGGSREDGKKWLKFGIHFIFPKLYVNSHMALMLRETFISSLTSEYGPRNKGNSWAKVVDERIYTHNGLRMTYSVKWDCCSHCKGNKKSKEECSHCMTIGKVIVNKSYKPFLILGGQSVFEGKPVILTDRLKFIQQNIHHCLHETVIRTNEGTKVSSGWKNYLGAPVYDLKNCGASSLKRAVSKKVSSGELVKINSGPSHASSNRTTHQEKSEKFLMFQDFVRRNMPPIYSKIEAQDVYSNLGCTYYIMRTSGEGKNYCQNKGTDHPTSTIYFYMTPNGICQKCWCRCPTTDGRKYGYCKDYSSEVYQIPLDMVQIFFPKVYRERNSFRHALFGSMDERGDALKNLANAISSGNITVKATAIQEANDRNLNKTILRPNKRIKL